MSFGAMKKNREAMISKMTAAAEQSESKTKNYNDDRKWKLTVDKAQNGFAEIRFLPAAEGEELPWVKYWDHAFKGPTGQWYMEKSLTTIGQQDPLGEANQKLWNSGFDDDKTIVRERKRRLHYVSNIMVISDPANPQNEGKVFLYEYGKKIFDMLMDAMNPEFPDEKPMNPFDFWEGANFKIKARKVDGYRNYDKSDFGPIQALSDDDAKLEGLYNSLYPLKEFTDPKSFKSYNELQARLNLVLGESAGPSASAEAPGMTFEEPKGQTAEYKPKANIVDNSADEDDGAMSFFANLAADD
jgi:hypothetical protein